MRHRNIRAQSIAQLRASFLLITGVYLEMVLVVCLKYSIGWELCQLIKEWFSVKDREHSSLLPKEVVDALRARKIS